ncbi:MAG: arginase family protein [Pseudomonadota bacterium]
MINPDPKALFGAEEVETFLGLDACDDLDTLTAPVALIAALGATPYRGAGPYCRNGPAALRAAMVADAPLVDRHNFDVGGMIFPNPDARAVDCGDLPFDEENFAANRAAIRSAIETVRRRGAAPILLGGDDSVPIPMIEAMAGEGPCTILQIDAHIDWRDEYRDERMGLSSTMRRASEMSHIERIVQVGARNVGSAYPEDYQTACDWGAVIIPARAVHGGGVQPVLEQIPQGSRIILCVDVDALDPGIVPGVLGRAPGGLSYFQALDLIEGAAHRGQIVAVDFVEYVPERDVDELGALTVGNLIMATMGLLARQAISKDRS